MIIPARGDTNWRRYAVAIHRAAVLKGLAEEGSAGEIAQLVLGLNGEAGEVANDFKKVLRGDRTLVDALPALALELADVAIYLNILAVTLGVDLEAACEDKMTVLRRRWPDHARFMPPEPGAAA